MADPNPYEAPGAAPAPEAPAPIKRLANVSLGAFPAGLLAGSFASKVAADPGAAALIASVLNITGALVALVCGGLALAMGRNYAPTGVRTQALIGTCLGAVASVGLTYIFVNGYLSYLDRAQ